MIRIWILIAVMLSGCDLSPESPKVRIAMNPWPGYEFLYLASQKGFFEEFDLDIELVELASLADVQRVYTQGRADGIASTTIEMVHVVAQTKEPLTLVLVPDYSNGADVIVSPIDIRSLKDLKGKVVSVELGSLGLYFLSRALESEGMNLSDVVLGNSEQLDLAMLFEEESIDAATTYPPVSTTILRDSNFHILFDSSEIPKQVIDVISVKSSVIEQDPTWISRFHSMWQKTMAHVEKNPEESYQIMATREGISAEEFVDALEGLKMIPVSEQSQILVEDIIAQNVIGVCEILNDSQAISENCEDIESLILVPSL